MFNFLFAQGSQPVSPGAGMFTSFFPLILIFVIFYFLLIRPQQKKMREHQKLLRELKKGDRILTNGGIYGTIVNLKGNILEVKIAEEIKIELTRSAVAEVIGSEEQATT
ncbi:MAG TPA: preprotein translocase subunit YajC [Elusimicrobia bacterium]|jgi:preprotein translocase subunit YajC|nr:preprotein translocase subunit YajC [Elusimicrobiota bacterium]